VFGDKHFDNLGFPTPEETPEETGCRQLSIPSNTAWFGVFMGCLELLTHPENWQQYEGGMSREAAAETAQQVIDEAYALAELGQCNAIIETPYWDTAANVVFDEPVDTQPWYGVLYDSESSFRENVENWALAGMVAYAAGPGAAIAFLTIARRFRIAVRQHDLGGIVRAFIDGAQVAEVDTYSASPNIVFLDIFADKVTPGDGPWELWVEQPNDDKAEIVRMELNPADVYPTNQRYDEGTDTIQTLGSDGSTWVDSPQADPRHAASGRLPAVIASDVKCQAASNMSRWISDFIANTLTPISEGLDAIGILSLLVSLLLELGPFGILVDLVLALAVVLVSAGATAINAAFTNDVFDTLVCIFYCEIGEDGSVTADQLTQILTDINNQIGGLVYTVLSAMFFLMGEVGLSNAGVVGDDPSPNCAGCPDCLGCYEWTAPSVTNFISGNYTVAQFHGALSPDVRFAKITIDWHLRPNSGATLQDAYIYLSLSGGTPLHIPIATTTGEWIYTHTIPYQAESSFDIRIYSWYSGGSNYPLYDLVRFEYKPDAGVAFVGGAPC